MVAKKEERKIKKRKGIDDRTLIRSNLTIYHLIFCGPEQTKEKMAITRDLWLWIHPTTLCISSPCRPLA
jgi:hypothetical protein